MGSLFEDSLVREARMRGLSPAPAVYTPLGFSHLNNLSQKYGAPLEAKDYPADVRYNADLAQKASDSLEVLEAHEKEEDLKAYSRIRCDILMFFGDAHVPDTLDSHFGYVAES